MNFESKICVFDMDGTIVDTVGFWRRCPERYLTKLGKTIKAGENIEFSEQDGVLTIKGTGLEYREDISFTADSLNDGKLTVSECSIGSCCVMDNNGNLVMPDQQQSGSDVILNLSGYTITGTWKVKFIQGRTGGVTPEYAQQMATTYAIIFGS